MDGTALTLFTRKNPSAHNTVENAVNTQRPVIIIVNATKSSVHVACVLEAIAHLTGTLIHDIDTKI